MTQLFTDAGQYVIRFGSSDPSSKTGPARMVYCQIKKYFCSRCFGCFFHSIPYLRFWLQVQDLAVTRPLTLSERAVTVALAISLDNDYFSRHGGW